MWPAWFHCVADVIALVTAEALSDLPSLCVLTSFAWLRIAASPCDVIGRKKVAFPTVVAEHLNAFCALADAGAVEAGASRR